MLKLKQDVLNLECAFTCGVDQVVDRVVLFALQRGHAYNTNEHVRRVYDFSGNGPASLVVPRHPAHLHRQGVLM